MAYLNLLWTIEQLFPQPEQPKAEQIGCVGKHRFSSRALAVEIAGKQSERRKCKSEPYKCEACGGWHIGTKFLKSSWHRPMKEL